MKKRPTSPRTGHLEHRRGLNFQSLRLALGLAAQVCIVIRFKRQRFTVLGPNSPKNFTNEIARLPYGYPFGDEERVN